MATHASDFEPDESIVADRTPCNCPFCGHSGAFDGQGEWPDSMEITKAGVTTEFDRTWYQARCPECNGRFQMLTDVSEVDQ